MFLRLHKNEHKAKPQENNLKKVSQALKPNLHTNSWTQKNTTLLERLSML